MRLVALSFAVASIVLAGCSATENGGSAGDEADVVGISDFEIIEKELGLTKDGADGNFERADAKLEAGPCFKQTKGGANGDSFDVRRYKDGAAFFGKKLDEQTKLNQPLVCIDLDTKAGETISIDGVALDTAVRYHIGRPLGFEKQGTQEVLKYEKGALAVSDAIKFCETSFGRGSVGSAALTAGFEATLACEGTSGVEADKCEAKAEQACRDGFAKDIETDSIDLPATSHRFIDHLEVDGAGRPTGSLLAIVHKFALRRSTEAEVFSIKEDPMGKFLKFEQEEAFSGPVDHMRFDRLDAHRSMRNGQEQLAITPKLSDKNVAANALVFCTRTVHEATIASPFECKGL